MQTLTLHTPQEIAELYKQLSAIQKNELFNFLTKLLNEENNSPIVSEEEFEKLRADGLERLQNPTIRAVFERLKDK